MTDTYNCPNCGAEITDPAAYWINQMKAERKRANDNLRLAAECATEINELRELVEELRGRIEEMRRPSYTVPAIDKQP